jgi:ubiquitin-conjugating enzyme E2 variant
MATALEFLGKFLLCILAADFLSGLFHWIEDGYGRPHWPITGKHITRPNMLHHRDATAFTANSWMRSADVLLVLGALVLAGAAALGLLNWLLLLTVLLGINANEIHKWSHRPRSQNGVLISFLQDQGIIQSPRHHARHHGGNKDTHYCVITNYLNPILDRLRFWRVLERVVFLVLRVRRRPD